MNFLELLALAAIWGASFLFMRIGAPQFGFIAFSALRVLVATLVLLVALLSPEARRQFRSKALPLCIVGLTNSAIPFCLFAYSSIYVEVGCDSILNATTPIWAAIIAFAWLKQPLRSDQIIGFALGFIGVLILAWGKLDEGGSGVPLAIAAALLATLFYGFAANYSKRNLAGVKPLVVAFGSQFFAAVLLVPLAAIFWPAHSISTTAWLSVLGIGVICTGIAYILYFRLIEHVSAAYGASVTFLIPVFGIVWGKLFLHEDMSQSTLIGAAIVLIGTALASGRLTLIKRQVAR